MSEKSRLNKNKRVLLMRAGNACEEVFTKELGLINASAQGVRYLKSKLRYSLHDFSFAELSLVRGKEFWRVTGAIKQINIHEALRGNPEIRAVFTRVFALLDRLLSGEEKNENLFNYLSEAVRFALAKKDSDILVRNFEYILVLRILFSLGYLGSSPDTSVFVESPFWSDDLLADMNPVMARILEEINKSLKESQL